jgi:hypothetical protein
LMAPFPFRWCAISAYQSSSQLSQERGTNSHTSFEWLVRLRCSNGAIHGTPAGRAIEHSVGLAGAFAQVEAVSSRADDGDAL